MIFRLIAILALPAMIFRLSLFRFQAATSPKGRTPEPFRPKAYLAWVGERLSRIAKPEARTRLVKVVEAWLKLHPFADATPPERRGREATLLYSAPLEGMGLSGLRVNPEQAPAFMPGSRGVDYPGWRIWIWAGLVLSFAYTAVSGLGYALFIPRGLWGVPLLLHVMAGGLFAVCLAAVVVLRARRYGFEPDKGKAEVQCLVCPVVKRVPIPLARALAFWIFVAAGLVLTTTALFSMLPWFVYTAQLTFIGVHRYAALAATLAAMAFVDLDLIPRRA